MVGGVDGCKRPSSPPGPCLARTPGRIPVVGCRARCPWRMTSVGFGGVHRRFFLQLLLLSLVPWPRTPLFFSPHSRLYDSSPHNTPTHLLCSFPVTPHRADPSYAIGLQPPSPKKPSVAVALRAVFAFFLIVTEARARRHPVQTITVVLLLISAPFHQWSSPLTMSDQSTPLADVPSFVASLRLLLLVILRTFKMVSLKPLSPS